LSKRKKVLAKINNTKNEIAVLGEKLIRAQGYHAFSYHDIASRLNVKNAAIHYHFPLKEDLVIEIIRKNIKGFEELLQNKTYSQLDEWDQLAIFMDEIFGKYHGEGHVCLVGALSTEFLTLPENVQKEFKLMTEEIRNWLTTLLKEGKKKKHFYFTTSAEVKALMIITNMIAGLQISRVMNKSDFQLIKSGILRELKTEQ
jgi:TetR/AcrR family transcriptional repressor of nem operon